MANMMTQYQELITAFFIQYLLLYLIDKDYSSHSQTIGFFNKEFIKTEIFPRQFGKWVYKLFEFRETGDYSINSSITQKDSIESIQHAEEILNTISDYINKTFS